MSQASTSTAPPPQPKPAAPPTRMEIERKLSFKSHVAPSPRNAIESPKKPKASLSKATAPPSAYAATTSGNDSDTSSVTSSTQLPPISITSPTHPTSPLLSPVTSTGLSSIAERQQQRLGDELDELEEMELEDVEEGDEEEGEGSGSDVGEKEGDLQRGMEGERVVKSGYLYKKQERRKAWKKKWFVLRTGKLAYYKDDKEYSLSRVIELKAVHTVAPVAVKKHAHTFGIVTSKRTFFAKAGTLDEMDEWVAAINGVRRKLSEKQEDERNTRERKAVNIPVRAGAEQDTMGQTHQGTFSSTSQSISSSPVNSTGYFTSNPNNMPTHPQAGSSSIPMIPTSPTEHTHSLSSQMAKLGMNRSPSIISQPLSPRLPSIGISQAQSRNVSTTSARREPSTGSVGSTDYFPRVVSASVTAGMISSDEDEGYFSDPNAAFPVEVPVIQPTSPPGTVDPNKVILSAYLMKRSKKGRGRKVWRKRWFYLTSQGLTYTKSHMDSRALRYVPLSSILDALESHPTSQSDTDDTKNPSQHLESQTRSPPGQSKSKDGTANVTPNANEHTFRLITAKRTFVLCAPSEEDEIKWLAAFRALLNRGRSTSINTSTATGTGGPSSPITETTPRLPLPLPTITQQPPTPSTLSSAGPEMGIPPVPTTPAISTSSGPPVLAEPVSGDLIGQGQGVGNRGRSATYTAKSAVADVVRRFRDEREGH